MTDDIKVGDLLVGALSLTAALAWNDAAQSGVRRLVPVEGGDSFFGKFTYAVVVTIIILIVFRAAKGIMKVADETELRISHPKKAEEPASGATQSARPKAE